MPDRLSLQNTSSKALESAISITQQRHNIISSNISNLETPGYKPKDIDFKTAMAQALDSEPKTGLARTNTGHIGRDNGSEPEVEPFEENGEWNGFNWVSIDKVMNTMTENNLIYRVATETLLRKIAIMKEVIREGGR
ncbi:MAG: flagellar basal body rod protein FlgB [Desulfobacteraceae bacterium]|nr:MAG: flagellar basal body rod protein FlgB [Desulfobacteraceae bacterium]